MKFIVSLIDSITETAGKFSAWIFFAIGFCVCYEITVRNDFVRELLGTAPTIWVDEVSRIMQIWAAYLSAAYVLKHRKMVIIELILNNPNSIWRRLAETWAFIMTIIFAGIAVYFGFQLWLKGTLAGHTTDSYLAIPKWITHASIWVGFGLLAIQSMAEIYKIWTTDAIAHTDATDSEISEGGV